MSGPEQDDAVEALLARCLDAPAAERASRIERACAAHPSHAAALREQFDALRRLGLAADPDGTESLPAGPRDPIRPALPRAIAEPRAVGPYEVVRRLGQGGFGVVYLARQLAPVRRDVALKLLRPGLDGASLLARFASERQILALLDHPHIARFLDAGSAADGMPYFVMEHVDGSPIDEYCDRRALSIDRRIDLLAAVCDAVQHAHRKGILHRDLKPGNVLIAEVDGAPFPKIIDFGIAKALDAGDRDAMLTLDGQLVGTPAYMSPEQISLSAAHLDTRTDVYALGVIAYQLLTGALPLRPSGAGPDSLDELRHLIREVDPPPPSRLLTGDPAALASRATRCGSSPIGLVKRLRGDLDWIVAKALAKEPSRRYGSAAELAEDLRRHRRLEAVSAGPPSRRYRVARFVRRHRSTVLAGGALSAALVLGTIGTSLGYVGARAAQRRAEQAMTRTLAVSGFLREMLTWADPELGFAGDLTVRDLLDEAAPRVTASFAETPDVEAALQLTIGSAYHSLGHAELAEEHLRRSLEVVEAAAEADVPRDTAAEANRARAALAAVLAETGRLEEAEGWARAAVAHAQGDAAATANALSALGTVLLARGRPDDARGALTKGLVAAAKDGEDRPALRGSLTLSLCYALEELGENAAAERRLRAELPRHEARGREGWSLAMRMRSLLARLAGRRGAPEEALDLLRGALEQARALYGADHPEVARVSNDLAEVLSAEGRAAASEPLFRDAVRILDARFPGGSPVTATVLTNLAWLLGGQDRDDEAIAVLERVAAMQAGLLGPDHPDVANTDNDLAAVRRRRGEFDEAERLGEEALRIYVAAYGEEHRATAIAAHNLGVTVLERGEPARALPHLMRAHEILGRVAPTQEWMYAEFQKRVGDALFDLGRYADAAREYEAALRDVETRFGAAHRRATSLVKRLVMTSVMLDRFDDADRWRGRLPEDQRSFGLQQQEERRRARGS